MKRQEYKVEIQFASQPDEIRAVLCTLIADRRKKGCRSVLREAAGNAE